MSIIKVADLGGATVDQMDVGNPDFLHPIFMHTGPETKELFEKVPEFEYRADDVMLCLFPKTGTHWMYELLSMARAKSAEKVETVKVLTMFECKNAEEINTMPSPRVMNSHLNYRFLPIKGLREKQIKTVLCLRNPKDTAVSYYNHMHGINMYNYTGKWEDWLPVYLDGKFEYGKYTTWLKEWEAAIQEGVGFPLHILYYEDMKINGEAELERLLKFLEIDISEDLQRQIYENCGIKKLATTKYTGAIKDALFKKDFNIFRKGEVGDWKNWFTTEQEEMFDKQWTSEMKGSTMFNFKYTE